METQIQHTTARAHRRGWNRRSAQRGALLIWTLLGTLAMFVTAGLAIDLSFYFERRAEAQRVADTVALSYTYDYWTVGSTQATADANWILQASNYPGGLDGTYNKIVPWPADPYWFSAQVERQEGQIFGGVLGPRDTYVPAKATAEFIANNPGSGVPPAYFGIANSGIPVVFQVNGPTDDIRQGDEYSSKIGYDGNPNPLNAGFTGYRFKVVIPANYASKFGNTVQVQIYDPQVYDSSGGSTAWPYLDVIRDNASTFQFTLTGNNGMSSQVATYSSGTSSGENTWTTPAGFTTTVNPNTETDLIVNVLGTAGSSQDGFLLRAGPPDTNLATGPTATNGADIPTADTFSTNDSIYSTSWYTSNNDNLTYAQSWALGSNNPITSSAQSSFYSSQGLVTWHQKWADSGAANGDVGDNPSTASPDATGITVTALDHLPIIFTSNGSTTLELGSVPTGSTQVIIKKFDAGDEGTTTHYLYYESTSLPDSSQSDGLEHFPGNLTGDGLGTTDTINLPANYTTGQWTAHYAASVMDMSTWDMQYVGPGQGTVGLIATSPEQLW